MEDGRGRGRGGKREGDGMRRGEKGMRVWKGREERVEGEGGERIEGMGGDGKRGRSDDDSLLKYMCVYVNVSSACYCITRVHTCVHAR